MNRSRAIAIVGRIAIGLVVVSFGLAGLSYGVVLPDWPASALAAAATV